MTGSCPGPELLRKKDAKNFVKKYTYAYLVVEPQIIFATEVQEKLDLIGANVLLHVGIARNLTAELTFRSSAASFLCRQRCNEKNFGRRLRHVFTETYSRLTASLPNPFDIVGFNASC